MRTERLAAALVLGFLAAASAQTPLWTLPGRGTYEASGSSVAGIGDVDADGYADFAVGALPHVLLARPGLVRIHSGRDARLLHELTGDAPGDGFGVSVAGIGDADKDGVPDLAVGVALTEPNTTRRGQVRIFSGRDWRQLATLQGASVADWFGCSVRAAGDVDRDGWTDLIVGAAFDDTGALDAGAARVYSGRDWTVLRTFTGAASNDYFGYAVAAAGDVDNDGWPDLVVGAHMNDAAAVDCGSVYVYSGRDGRRLHAFTGDSVLDGFGFTVASAGDVDGDGHGDLLIGALWDDAGAGESGSVAVWSGRTGAQVRLHGGDGAYDGLGTSLALVGDQDGDGVPDYAAGAVQGFPPGNPGYLRVWSAKTGAPIHKIVGQSAGDWFGFAVDAAGDVNADGFPDIVVGVSHGSAVAARGGETTVIAGRFLALQTDRDWVSLATGGLQVLRLDARPLHAGKTCLVLGTMGKTRPGLPLGRVMLPLTFDDYTAAMLMAPNSPMFRLTLGLLDASGQRTAFLAVPPGLPPVLAGLRLEHSFVVLGAGGYDFASNPSVLRLLP